MGKHAQAKEFGTVHGDILGWALSQYIVMISKILAWKFL